MFMKIAQTQDVRSKESMRLDAFQVTTSHCGGSVIPFGFAADAAPDSPSTLDRSNSGITAEFERTLP